MTVLCASSLRAKSQTRPLTVVAEGPAFDGQSHIENKQGGEKKRVVFWLRQFLRTDALIAGARSEDHAQQYRHRGNYETYPDCNRYAE